MEIEDAKAGRDCLDWIDWGMFHGFWSAEYVVHQAYLRLALNDLLLLSNVVLGGCRTERGQRGFNGGTKSSQPDPYDMISGLHEKIMAAGIGVVG